MRYKVPQNIDMPDRIIGPLTMIQFVESVLGGGLAYICYNAFPKPFGLIVAIIAGLFTAAVVFMKVNERPFLFYFMAFLKYLATPKRRIWQKGQESDFDVEIYVPPAKTGQHLEHKSLDKDKLAEIAKNLDSQQVNNLRINQ